MNNVGQTIISQYANSPRLLALIGDMNDSIDPSTDIDSFYSFVWDLDSCQGFGLDIWGRIVGVSRLLEIVPDGKYLGFSESSDDGYPFGQEPFYNNPTAQAYLLSDDVYRVLIFMKALSNITDGTAPVYNQMLALLFSGRGRCYALELGSMQMQFTFEFYLEAYELAIIEQSGALAAPAGVSLSVLEVDVPNAFGFSEAGIYEPFGYGVFQKDIIQVN